jgi:hypothetical protein
MFKKIKDTFLKQWPLFLFVIIIICFGYIVVDEERTKQCLLLIKKILGSKLLYSIIFFSAFLLGIFISVSKRNNHIESNLFKIFGPVIDPTANSIGYGIVICSTLTLIKGIFNQLFFKEIYYKDFGIIDISAILLSCIPLLTWSVSGLFNLFRMAFFSRNTSTGTANSLNNSETPPEED